MLQEGSHGSLLIMVATALTQNLYLGKWRQPYQLPPLEKGVQTLSIER